MEQSCDFQLGTTDPEIAGRFRSCPTTPAGDRRATQEGEFHLVLPEAYEVAPFGVHHDVANLEPSPAYLAVIRSLADQGARLVPGVFSRLEWAFHPRDLFRPFFYQVFQLEGRPFLYLFRPDLSFRGRFAELLERGTNNLTARFRTNHLFYEAEVLPLARWEGNAQGRRLWIAKLFENTWVGETGRSYLRTGRWIDQDLTKLLSKAVLAPGRRAYPFYPLRCRLGTLAAGVGDLTLEGRRRACLGLAQIWSKVSGVAEPLQRALKAEPYRDDHPLLEVLRARLGAEASRPWGDFRLEPFLTQDHSKEYAYHDS